MMDSGGEEESDVEYIYSDLEDTDDREESIGGEGGGRSASAPTGGGDAGSGGGRALTSGQDSGYSEALMAMIGPGGDEVKILKEDELTNLMEGVVEEVSTVLSIPKSAATALLQHFSWNTEKVFDKFYADIKAVTEAVGIDNAGMGFTSCSEGEIIFCSICCETVPGNRVLALPCLHYFCRACWKNYLHHKVEDGPSCVCVNCPQPKCGQKVGEELFEALLEKSSAEMVKYRKYALSSFVGINRHLRFCPGKMCNRVASGPALCPYVKCDCGEVFCFKCGEESHEPVTCENLVQWKEKCQNESETANWILANTKKCPKCCIRIEKNQGCNHMTCCQCRFEFCWICMDPWDEHGAGTGGYYRCNRYEACGGGKDSAARAKAELDRYLHYYRRWNAHYQSQKFAMTQQLRTERRMIELQEASDRGAWVDVQFLKAAMEQLIQCRRALKYTYIFGYYLKGDTAQKQLFEHHQENLEIFTERLSELSEMGLEEMTKRRPDIINNTRVTGKFLHSIKESIREGLRTGEGLNNVALCDTSSSDIDCSNVR